MSAPIQHVDSEKASDLQLEHGKELSPAQSAHGDYAGKGSEKKLLRKIDFRLVPALAFAYGCSLIDRTNLPNARLAGMDIALGTNLGDRYSVITLVFFVTYILFEIPANLALKRGVPPRLWLPGATLCFGVIMIGFAFVPDWNTLAGLRALLGVFEAVLFPGAVFMISSYYPRYETGRRLSAFYLMGQVLGGFSNILAYGFSQIAPAGGRTGWQWIFIMCGVLTCIAALVAFVLVPNFPQRQTFLNAEESELLQARIQADRHDFEEEKMSTAIALKHMANWRIWCFGLLFLCSTLPAYAFSLALILRGFGYSVRDSQLLSAPPYFAAILFGLIIGYVSDKFKIRGPFIILGGLVSLTGSLITAYTTANGVRYFGAFLAVMGCQCVQCGSLATFYSAIALTPILIPAVMSWSSNSVRGYGARAINSAVVVAGGGVGGIVASVAFRQKDAASGYRPGLWTTVAFQLLLCGVSLALMAYFRYQNRLADRNGKVLEGHPAFRYTL